MPTFLYPFLSLHALLALGALWQVEMSRYERLREWVADSLRIATGVWVCYFPVFLLNGVAAVVANDTVRRLPPDELWARLPEHIANTCNFLTGVTADTLSGESCVMGGFVGLLALAAWHRSRLKSASAYLYVGAAWLLVTPLLWLAFHRVVPFERTWVYLTLPLGIALTGVLGLADGVVFSWRRQLNPNIGYSVLLALVLVVLGIETTQFSEQYDRLHNEDYELGTALARMPEGEDVRIYTNFWWTQTTVEYELATKGKTHIQGLDTEDSYNATNVYTLVILERGRATDQAVRFTTDPAYRLLLKGHRADFYYYSK